VPGEQVGVAVAQHQPVGQRRVLVPGLVGGQQALPEAATR
jgi:hypothetical protein